MYCVRLAMTCNYEMNLIKREAIRPYFKSTFANPLCSASNCEGEFLFGGDTSKVKEKAELKKNIGEAIWLG